MAFRAHRVNYIDTQTGEFKTTPIDMKGVSLQNPEEVRAWLIGPPPGYLKTHPELAGTHMVVFEDTH